MARRIINVEFDERHGFEKVGQNGCKEIIEHPAQGEGDRWFFDIHYDNGEMMRVFNPTKAYYAQEGSKPEGITS